MRAELRDRLLEKFDANAKWAGVADYEAAMFEFGKMLSGFQKRIAEVRTREDLSNLLDQLPEPSIVEEKIILAVFRYMPQLLRVGARKLADALERDIPPPPPGRAATDLQTKTRIVAYVGELHTRGYGLEVAKKSAARKFEVSESSVQRYWDDRGNIDEADFWSAMKWLSEPS